MAARGSLRRARDGRRAADLRGGGGREKLAQQRIALQALAPRHHDAVPAEARIERTIGVIARDGEIGIFAPGGFCPSGHQELTVRLG